MISLYQVKRVLSDKSTHISVFPNFIAKAISCQMIVVCIRSFLYGLFVAERLLNFILFCSSGTIRSSPCCHVLVWEIFNWVTTLKYSDIGSRRQTNSHVHNGSRFSRYFFRNFEGYITPTGPRLINSSISVVNN